MELEPQQPFTYGNWKAMQQGFPLKRSWEIPLFTSASHIVGEITAGLGPYQIINTLSMGSMRPSLILRIDEHRVWEQPLMEKTNDSNYHGGGEDDEIAALLSLCLGVRVKAGGPTRVFNLTQTRSGRPIGWSSKQDPDLAATGPKHSQPIVRSAFSAVDLVDCMILTSVPDLSRENIVALVRSARMYQEGLWIVETAPELSWLMFIAAVETVASQWSRESFTALEKMRASRPELEEILLEYGGEHADELVLKIAEKIAPYMGATKTFRDFILTHIPEPPRLRPSPNYQFHWERTTIKKALDLIYKYRSRALHGSHPFPAPMCAPAWKMDKDDEPIEIPLGLAISAMGSVWVAKDIPMLLHMFEYIARNSILNWWKSLIIEES